MLSWAVVNSSGLIGGTPEVDQKVPLAGYAMPRASVMPCQRRKREDNETPGEPTLNVQSSLSFAFVTIVSVFVRSGYKTQKREKVGIGGCTYAKS